MNKSSWVKLKDFITNKFILKYQPNDNPILIHNGQNNINKIW
jgi:hypothetical protein